MVLPRGRWFSVPSPLLADAKIPENHVQNVFHIDAAKEPAQCSRRQPQLLRHDFFAAVPCRLSGPVQGKNGLPQMRALALTGHQSRLLREEALGEAGDGGNQMLHAQSSCTGDKMNSI